MSGRQRPVDMAEHRRAVDSLNGRGEATRAAGKAIRSALAKTVARLVATYPGRERAIEEALEGQAAEMLARRAQGTRWKAIAAKVKELNCSVCRYYAWDPRTNLAPNGHHPSCPKADR